MSARFICLSLISYNSSASSLQLCYEATSYKAQRVQADNSYRWQTNSSLCLLPFTWSLAISIMAVKTFTSPFGQLKIKRYNVVNLRMMSIYVPGIIYTTLCFALSKIGNLGAFSIAYGQENTGLCLISNDPPISMIFGMNAPAGLLLLVSLLNLIITCIF